MRNRWGKDNPNWKGDNVGYHALHDWVRSHRGKASVYPCALADATCKTKKMEWSNISRKYLRKLSDWQVLCKSHHLRFDMTDEWRKKIIESQKGEKNPNFGKSLSEETKRKMSESAKRRGISDELQLKMSEARVRYWAQRSASFNPIA